MFTARNGVKTPYSVENLVDRVTIYQILYYGLNYSYIWNDVHWI